MNCLLSSKSKQLRCRIENIRLVFFLIMSAAVLLGGCLPSSQDKPVSVKVAAREPNKINASEFPPAKPAETDADFIRFENACQLLAQDESGRFVGLVENADKKTRNKLTKIVGEYEAVIQNRQLAKEEAYQKQLAKLEKLQLLPEEVNDVNIVGNIDFNDVNEVNDINDVNDANSISKEIAVIVRAFEFANQQQKKELRDVPFVQQIIQTAKDRAAEFESKGKWLDAYVACYSWLDIIEPNNNKYSDYADNLLEKAGVIASLQDSPCESSRERFWGVKKKMFVRAIDALNYNYVSILNYSEMAKKAINRCKLLAEVVSIANEQEPNKIPYTLNTEKMPDWYIGLSVIEDGLGQMPLSISKGKFVNILDEVITLNIETVDFPETVLIAQFVEAALSALDPYTVMVWPRQVEDFKKMMTNEFSGIGVEISKRSGLLTVASLMPDTPAYNSGLDAGDTIEKVDGVSTRDMTLSCAVKRITGPENTEVILTVRSENQSISRDIAITRAKIIVPTIRGWKRTQAGKWQYSIDDADGIGYIRIVNFSDKTASNFQAALEELQVGGLNGLVIDLRFNPGGLLNSATEIADKFIEDGLIVSTRPRLGVWTYAYAHKKDTHPDYPLVILINSRSASASEIVAGALSDKLHNRAVLVGERTHGKGSVQGITGHPGKNTQLKYTMAYYHLPSGQRVESRDAMEKQGRSDWGVGPDIEMKLRSDELIKMIDAQRDNSVLVKADHDNGTVPLSRHTAENTIESDPQLAVGIMVLKTKIIEKKLLAENAKDNL